MLLPQFADDASGKTSDWHPGEEEYEDEEINDRRRSKLKWALKKDKCHKADSEERADDASRKTSD